MKDEMSPELLCMNCMYACSEEGLCPTCGFDEANYRISPHHLPLRSILNGKYLVGCVLGEGGFGITYLGRDLNLDLKIAIKEYYPTGFVTRENTTTNTVMPYAGDKTEFFQSGRDKFVEEAKRLAKFYTLPGIVSIKDFFLENGTAYIVMEYVEGQTLKQYLLQMGGKVPADMMFELMKPLMRSLNEIHRAGIIHRDISPDNIMITKEGNIKLIDFGAARDFANSGNKSLSVMLKPGYAPEEQYRSRGVQGPWTDIYALCATIYKAVTGVTPDESSERIREDELKKPSELGVEIRTDQEAALCKGMAVLQEKRYQNIDELTRDLYATGNAGRYTQNAGSDQKPAHEQIPAQDSDMNQTSATDRDSDMNQTPATDRDSDMNQTPATDRNPDINRMSAANRNPNMNRMPAADQTPAIYHNGDQFFKLTRNTKRILAGTALALIIVIIFYFQSHRDDGRSSGSNMTDTTQSKSLVDPVPEDNGGEDFTIPADNEAYNTESEPDQPENTEPLIGSTNGDEGEDTQSLTSDDDTPENDISPATIPETAVDAVNTSGNIINECNIVAQGDWLYCSFRNSLYKIGKDGGEKTVLFDGLCTSLAISGDWIYFCNMDDKETLYRINIDGTGLTKMDTSENCRCINAAGEWIYYSTWKEGTYKIRPDGSDKTLLISDTTYEMTVSDDWIYYSTNPAYYKMRTDGTQITKLLDSAYNENVVGDWIYYNNNSLYKMKTDGTENTRLNDVDSNDVNVNGDWIYYTSWDENSLSSRLYKMRTDGSEVTKLHNVGGAKINIIEDWIYYLDPYDLYYHQIKTDGSKEKKIK